MRVYTGQTRSKRAIALCERLGLGECVSRGELPPRRTASGWFLDCGAFVDWRAGRAFDFVRWERDLRYVAYRIEAGVLPAPDFIVMPDIVGGGAASPTRSVEELVSVPPEPPGAVRRGPGRHGAGAGRRSAAAVRRRVRRRCVDDVEARDRAGLDRAGARTRCEEQQLSGAIVRAASPRDALHASHEAYTRIQARVLDNVKRWLTRAQESAGWLGGDPALERALQDHVVAFVMDTMLSTAVGTLEPTPDRVAELADEYYADYLAPLVDEVNDKDAEAEAARQDTLRRALADDLSGRQSWHARLLQGSTGWETRRYLQAAFNRGGASPAVLVAQSQVGREGLNLHKACRVVLQFHAEWNPAILEQQIGRVDRKGSYWEERARRWLDGGSDGLPSFIEVRRLIFEGTYDAYKWDRVSRRQLEFDASLFGALLPHDAWARVPAEHIETLTAAAPAFAPR